MIKTIGLRNLHHCICNIMSFVAAVTFVVYQKVHLLLNDIAVVAVEGDELQFSELHNSHFLHVNSRK